MRRFNWDISYDCNFACPYCFCAQAGRRNGECSQGKYRSPEEVAVAWKKVHDSYGDCVIYITGGEPFLYPEFTETVAGISAYHRIHITSNLSQPLEAFIAKVDRSRVELNATYHPRSMELEEFAWRVLMLRTAGFACGACYLAHPTQLREMINYRRYLQKAGIDLGVTEFSGTCENKEYPAAYTPGERAYMNYVARWNSPEDDLLPLAPLRENSCLKDAPGPMRISCRAGSWCADISPDGGVRPCSSSSMQLGNIFDGTMALLEQPLSCAVVQCYKAVRSAMHEKRN